MNEQDIRTLSAANELRGWVAIPEGCPAQIAARIIEKRAKQIGFKPSQQEPTSTLSLHDKIRAASLL